jgi:hypothetical protein
MTTEEGNKLIAEFMYPTARKEYEAGDIDIEDGIFKKGCLIFNHLDLMKYHSSWDWLMPVVEKIEGLNYKSSITYKDHVYECEFYIIRHKLYSGFSPNSKILSVWNAVIEYVKSNNPENPQ